MNGAFACGGQMSVACAIGGPSVADCTVETMREDIRLLRSGLDNLDDYWEIIGDKKMYLPPDIDATRKFLEYFVKNGDKEKMEKYRKKLYNLLDQCAIKSG